MIHAILAGLVLAAATLSAVASIRSWRLSRSANSLAGILASLAMSLAAVPRFFATAASGMRTPMLALSMMFTLTAIVILVRNSRRRQLSH